MSSSSSSKTSKTNKPGKPGKTIKTTTQNKKPIRKVKKKKFKKVKILSNPPQLTEEEMIEMYKKSLNDLELKVLEIAESHLKTSFDMGKSIGYLKWKKKNNYK